MLRFFFGEVGQDVRSLLRLHVTTTVCAESKGVILFKNIVNFERSYTTYTN